MDSHSATQLLQSQRKVIDTLSTSSDIEACFTALCRELECCLESDASVSLSLIKGNQITLLVAPNLNASYVQSMCGGVLMPGVGSCGEAHFTGKQVVSHDIQNDPLWPPEIAREAAKYGVGAKCSTPLKSSDRIKSGSLSVNFPRAMHPTQKDLEAIEHFKPLAILAIEKSINVRRQQTLSQDLHSSNEKLKAFTRVMPDLAFVFDDQGRYIDIYGGYSDKLSADYSSLIGTTISESIGGDMATLFMDVIQTSFNTNESQILEYELDVQSGRRIFEGRTSIIHSYDPENSGERYLLWIARDITTRKNAEKRIKQLAFYDSLTQLPNRRVLLDRLQHVVSTCAREHKLSALLYIDLDSFKQVNDNLGHHVGDTLLCDISKRLGAQTRAADTLARIGGDEFVVLLGTVSEHRDHVVNEARRVGHKLIKTVCEPLTLENHAYQIGASIGVCLIEGDDLTAGEVLRRADASMYDSKSKGGNCVSFFDPQLQIINTRRLQAENAIVNALENDEFSCSFQPQLSPQGDILGAEALLRWTNSSRGLVPPSEFIPIAERCGVLNTLQTMVFERCCTLLNDLKNKNLIDNAFKLSINLSPAQLRDTNTFKHVKQLLNDHHVSARNFVFELKESAFLADDPILLDKMNELHAIGFNFSIDDFGKAYSSIATLHNFPVHQLKLNRSFVNMIQSADSESKLMDAMISLSEHLEFDLIIEGIESSAQAIIMETKKIKGMQGYHYARPMDAENFMKWISQMNQKQRTMSINKN